MDMFSALAEPHRRSILEMLASEGQLSASAIARKFRLSPPAISQHLKVLREAGLLRMEKRAQQRLYQVNPQAMHELEDWARRMAQQYERRFDALERIAKREQEKLIDVKAERTFNTNPAGGGAGGTKDTKEKRHKSS